jgi:hypothetical protein
MMSLANFTLAFYLLCPPIKLWAKHVNRNGEIGQRHHEDAVVQDEPLETPSTVTLIETLTLSLFHTIEVHCTGGSFSGGVMAPRVKSLSYVNLARVRRCH